MNFDGRYKLHRYSTGDEMLFDLKERPDGAATTWPQTPITQNCANAWTQSWSAR